MALLHTYSERPCLHSIGNKLRFSILYCIKTIICLPTGWSKDSASPEQIEKMVSRTTFCNAAFVEKTAYKLIKELELGKRYCKPPDRMTRVIRMGTTLQMVGQLTIVYFATRLDFANTQIVRVECADIFRCDSV